MISTVEKIIAESIEIVSTEQSISIEVVEKIIRSFLKHFSEKNKVEVIGPLMEKLKTGGCTGGLFRNGATPRKVEEVVQGVLPKISP